MNFIHDLKPVEIWAILSVLFILIGTAWYVPQIFSKKFEPVLASWIVNTVAIFLSFITYWTTPKHTIIGGALNIASMFTISSILVSTCIANWKTLGATKFTVIQVRCLYFSGFIAVLWIVLKFFMNGTGFWPNILTQLMMAIAYFLNIEKVWSAKAHKDSIFLWLCILASSLIGLWVAHLKGNDILSWVYASRSTLMCSVLVFALCRIEWRNQVRLVKSVYVD